MTDLTFTTTPRALLCLGCFRLHTTGKAYCSTTCEEISDRNRRIALFARTPAEALHEYLELENERAKRTIYYRVCT